MLYCWEKANVRELNTTLKSIDEKLTLLLNTSTPSSSGKEEAIIITNFLIDILKRGIENNNVSLLRENRGSFESVSQYFPGSKNK